MFQLSRLSAAGLAAVALAGCGGNDGDAGAATLACAQISTASLGSRLPARHSPPWMRSASSSWICALSLAEEVSCIERGGGRPGRAEAAVHPRQGNSRIRPC